MTTTIYIAGASAEIERCEAFRDAAKALGYVITFDWMAARRATGKADCDLTDAGRRSVKRDCYDGASTCDAFVLLLPGWREQDAIDREYGVMSRAHTIGAWGELGYAEATRHNVTWGHPSREFLIVGDSPERTVMTAGLPHYETDDAALRQLAEMIGADA